MKICFRVDASKSIGTGHLVRCLVLADAVARLQGECFFLLGSIDDYARNFLRTMRHPFHVLDAGEAGRAVVADAFTQGDGATCDWLVVDHYGLDARWEQSARAGRLGKRLLVIDDLADRPHDCDVLVDPGKFRKASDYAALMQRKADLLLGTQYAILKPRYADCHGRSPVWPSVRRVHVFFGGGSPGTWLPFYVQATLEAIQGVSVLAVGNADPAAMNRLLAQYSGRLEWRAYVDDMTELYTRCDLSIGSPGTATWERACLGLPAGLLATSGNQMPILMQLNEERFCSYFGPAWALDADDYKRRLLDLVGDQENLRHLRAAGLSAVDGHGAARIARTLMGQEALHA